MITIVKDSKVIRVCIYAGMCKLHHQLPLRKHLIEHISLNTNYFTIQMQYGSARQLETHGWVSLKLTNGRK